MTLILPNGDGWPMLRPKEQMMLDWVHADDGSDGSADVDVDVVVAAAAVAAAADDGGELRRQREATKASDISLGWT